MKYADIGTVSHGTMQPRDLIPAFMSALDALLDRNTYTSDGDERELVALATRGHNLLASIELARAESGADYYGSEAADDDLATLFDLLDEFAPPGHYFGAHCGDGADYGFWPQEDAYPDEPPTFTGNEG